MTSLSCSEQGRLNTALHEIAEAAGIDPTGARFLRYTMNAVFHLPEANVVLRIAPADHIIKVRQVALVAARLTELGQPTTRLAPGIEEPIETPSWAATAWTYLPQPVGHRHQLTDLAAPLLSLHAIHNLGLPIPEWDVVERSEARVREAAASAGRDLTYLTAWAQRELSLPIEHVLDRLLQRCAHLRATIAAAAWAIPVGVIHGDAHAGNLLSAEHGVVLGDLDSVNTGPPEWDLVPAAHGVERFADPRHQYDEFVSAYGFDLLSSPNWPVLRDMRELQLVTSVIGGLPGRPDVAHELGHRLRSFLGGDSATWHRYR